jgi:hypothetical protein
MPSAGQQYAPIPASQVVDDRTRPQLHRPNDLLDLVSWQRDEGCPGQDERVQEKNGTEKHTNEHCLQDDAYNKKNQHMATVALGHL